MHQSLLITALNTINKKEWKAFCNYVEGVCLRKNQKLFELVQYIGKYYPNLEHKRLTKEIVYRHLFPKSKYHQLKINNLISDLYKLLEEFLVIQRLSQHPHLQKQFLLQEWRERGLEKHFQRGLKAGRREAETAALQDRHFFWEQYLIEEEADRFYDEKGKRAKDESLQRRVDYFDLYYLASKLRFCCEMVNREKVIQVEYEYRMMEEVMQFVCKHMDYLKDYPAVMVYYQILQTLLNHEEERYYQELIQLLEKHSTNFSKQEAQELYAYAQNYCVLKINSGQTAYLNELLQLYQQLLDKALLIENGVMSQWNFKNIVTVGLRLRQFDWAIHFVEEYKDYLKPEEKENAYYYNLASLYYGQKRYQEAMERLLQVELNDVSYYLGTKSLLLKIYYEIEETEALFSLVDAVKIYMIRTKLIPKYQKDSYLNLLKFTQKAYKIKSDQAYADAADLRKKWQQLQTAIADTPNIANVNWLREKVGELG